MTTTAEGLHDISEWIFSMVNTNKHVCVCIYIQCAYQLKTNNCVTLTLGHVKCPELMLSQLGIITCCLSHEHAFKHSRRQAERQKRSGASEKPQWRMTVLAVQSDKTLPLSNYKGCSGVMLHWFCVLYTDHGESSLSTHTQVHFFRHDDNSLNVASKC